MGDPGEGRPTGSTGILWPGADMRFIEWFKDSNRRQLGDSIQFGGLLLLMIAWLFLLPILDSNGTGSNILVAGFSLITIQALSITAHSHRERMIFGLWVMVLLLSPLLDLPDLLETVIGILAGALLIFVPVRLSIHVLNHSKVDANTIFGALCAYLFLGMSWAVIYEILLTRSPGAIAIPEGTGQSFSTHVYFSFTTLTTLGYGDVTPRGSVARMLAVMEALIGQVYLVVIVARLVADHMRSPRQKG
jgi:hypothetical protein